MAGDNHKMYGLWYFPLMSSQQAEKEKKARLPKLFDTQI